MTNLTRSVMNSTSKVQPAAWLRVLKPIPMAASLLVFGATQVACGGGGDAEVFDGLTTQPVLGVRSKSVLTVDGKQYRDLNGNGKVDLYEDWRRSVERRVDDLVALMTLEEKAGLMLIDTLNGGCGGAGSAASRRECRHRPHKCRRH